MCSEQRWADLLVGQEQERHWNSHLCRHPADHHDCTGFQLEVSLAETIELFTFLAKQALQQHDIRQDVVSGTWKYDVR